MADLLLNLRKVWHSIPRPKSDIARRLARGSFWSLIGEAGARGFSFISTILVARWLGIQDYGAFALVQSTLTTVTAFAAFGLGLTSARYIAAHRDSDPAKVESVNGIALSFSAATGALTAIGLFVGAPYLATHTLNAPQVIEPLRIVAPTLFLYTMSGALGGVIMGFEAFRQQTWITFVTGAVGFATLVAGALLGGLHGAFYGLLAAEACRFALTLYVARRIMREKGLRLFHPGRASDARVLWEFSLPLFLSSTRHAFTVWACQAIIAREPGGIAQIGLYDSATKWMTLVMLVPIAASGAISPVLSHLSGAEDGSASHRRTTHRLVLIQFLLTAAPALVMALAAPFATNLFFGEAFAGAAPVVVIMMITAPLFVLNNLYWRAFLSTANAWTMFHLTHVWMVVVIALTWLWRHEGAMGLAMALCIGQFVGLAIFAAAMEWLWRRDARANLAAAEAQA